MLQRYYAGQTQYAQFITFDPSAPGDGQDHGHHDQPERPENGADFALDYRVPLGNFNVPGNLNFTALVTWVNQLATFSTVGGVTTKSNRVGGDVYGSQGGPVPRYRGTVTVDYNLGKFGTTLQARGFSGFIFGTNFVWAGPEWLQPGAVEQHQRQQHARPDLLSLQSSSIPCWRANNGSRSTAPSTTCSTRIRPREPS